MPTADQQVRKAYTQDVAKIIEGFYLAELGDMTDQIRYTQNRPFIEGKDVVAESLPGTVLDPSTLDSLPHGNLKELVRTDDVPSAFYVWFSLADGPGSGTDTLDLGIDLSTILDAYNAQVVPATGVAVSFLASLVGLRLEINSGTGSGQYRIITAAPVGGGNEEVTVNADWVTAPDATSFYVIHPPLTDDHTQYSHVDAATNIAANHQHFGAEAFLTSLAIPAHTLDPQQTYGIRINTTSGNLEITTNGSTWTEVGTGGSVETKLPYIRCVVAKVDSGNSTYTWTVVHNKTPSDITDLNIFIIPSWTETILSGPTTDDIYNNMLNYPRKKATPGDAVAADAEPVFWVCVENDSATAHATFKGFDTYQTFALTDTGSAFAVKDAGFVKFGSGGTAGTFVIGIAWGWETATGNALNCGDTFTVDSGEAYPSTVDGTWYTSAIDHRFDHQVLLPSSPTVQAFGRDWVITAQNASWLPVATDVHEFSGADQYTVSSAFTYMIGGTLSNDYPHAAGDAFDASGVYVTVIKYTTEFTRRSTAAWDDILPICNIIAAGDSGFPSAVYWEVE